MQAVILLPFLSSYSRKDQFQAPFDGYKAILKTKENSPSSEVMFRVPPTAQVELSGGARTLKTGFEF